jgi:anti-sigma factor RsiW
MMCPKDEFLSAYLDQEIGSPWDKRLAAHLAVCPRCRERLAAWQAVSDRLRQEEVSGLEAEARLVRQRIAFTLKERAYGTQSAADGAERRSGSGQHVPFYKRQVVLPLPVLAAGLAALFILVASLFFFVGKSGNDLVQARNELDSLKTIHVYYPVQDPTRLYKAISDKNVGEEVVFEVPEENRFKVVGQPEVIYVNERK